MIASYDNIGSVDTSRQWTDIHLPNPHERDRTRSETNIRGQHRHHVSVRCAWNSWTTTFNQPEKGMVWCVTVVRLFEVSVNLGGIPAGVSPLGRFNRSCGEGRRLHKQGIVQISVVSCFFGNIVNCCSHHIK